MPKPLRNSAKVANWIRIPIPPTALNVIQRFQPVVMRAFKGVPPYKAGPYYVQRSRGAWPSFRRYQLRRRHRRGDNAPAKLWASGTEQGSLQRGGFAIRLAQSSKTTSEIRRLCKLRGKTERTAG